MGALATAVKAVIHLGGGQGYVTPHRNDVVNLDMNRPAKSVTVDKAMGYIPFFAAVRNISEDIAGLPLNVYRKTEQGRDRDASHPVDKLLGSSPNPYMTAFSFRETVQSHVLTWGNGLAEIEFDTEGRPMAMWPLRPDRTELLIDRSTGMPFYRYTMSNGQKVDLPRRNVFHVHGLGPDALWGYSTVELARRTLSMTLASEKYGETWYDKGGLPKAVLKHAATLSDTARTNLRESVEANYGTIEGRHRIMLLEEGMDLETIGVPAKDAAFLETMDSSQHLMATLFRMPPDMLQDIQRSTSWGTGIEQQGIGYVKYTLRGHLRRWEQEGNMRLLSGDDRYIEHIIDGLLRGDSAARWNSYRQGLDLGVYSIDDVLDMENRNRLPNGRGQQHFVQLNRAPLEQVGEMTMDQRLDAATDALDLPAIEHTGLEPVTVQHPALSVVKSAEVRCGGCNRLLAEHASPPYRIACSRCKAVTEAGIAAVETISQDEMIERIAAKVITLMPRPEYAGLDLLPERIAAAMPRQEPPQVNINEGAIKLNMAAPPTHKRVVRDAAGRITNVIEDGVNKRVVRDAAGRITDIEEA